MHTRVLVEKPEGKRLFGRPKRTLKDKIKMDLTINWMRWCGLD
jgi:hypothetical protein